jgi:hypothetical protein
MAQHDYVIDNQSATAFRADLNNALSAAATTNSGNTAPSTMYANMLWYETDTNKLWKRNEGNSSWISLGVVDESTSKFEPNQTFASQAQAEAGTDNTLPMTALRVKQGVSVLVANLTTSSGTSVVVSGLDLTPYRQLIFGFKAVSFTVSASLLLAGQQISPVVAADDFLRGMGSMDLANGACSFTTAASTGGSPVMALGATYAGDLGMSTASTSLTFTLSAGSFDNGTIRIYGYK